MRTTADRGEAAAQRIGEVSARFKIGSYVRASTMVEGGNNYVENSQVEVVSVGCRDERGARVWRGCDSAGGSELLVWAGKERECVPFA